MNDRRDVAKRTPGRVGFALRRGPVALRGASAHRHPAPGGPRRPSLARVAVDPPRLPAEAPSPHTRNGPGLALHGDRGHHT